MSTRRKIAYALLSILVVAGVVALVFYLRGLGKHQETPSSPTPKASASARGFSNEKFGPRARAQNTGNVDVGVRTLNSPQSPKPSASAKPIGSVILAQYVPPAPGSPPTPGNQVPPVPSPTPSATPVATPLPVATPPTFSPLPPPPGGNNRELVIAYAKGAAGKRQIYLRSIERDKDEQIVNSVYDDFGVSFSSASQKVAFYSNEEGPSDANRARSKLKVVDLATGKVTPIASGLPGAWPAAWSSDGKKLAIPTQNSIFLADVTQGNSLQVPTDKNPGGIVWSPGNLKLYFQAEAGRSQNTDLYEADGITAQARPVVATPTIEKYPSVSADGQTLSFIREGQVTPGPAPAAPAKQTTTVVNRNLASKEDRVYGESEFVQSYLWNLDLTNLVFSRGPNSPKLSQLKNKSISDIGSLGGVSVVAWDRDYNHVFVLADDDQSKALFSVDLKTSLADKIKAGISDSVVQTTR